MATSNPFTSRVQTFDDWTVAEELYRMSNMKDDLERQGMIHSMPGCHPYLTDYLNALNVEAINRNLHMEAYSEAGDSNSA